MTSMRLNAKTMRQPPSYIRPYVVRKLDAWENSPRWITWVWIPHLSGTQTEQRYHMLAVRNDQERCLEDIAALERAMAAERKKNGAA